MSFDQNGDAGTGAATEAALAQIATGEGRALSEMLERRRLADRNQVGARFSTIL